MLAERYVREFYAKWLRGGAPADEALVGSGDIQSLADLANSFEVVRTMGTAPVTREAFLQLLSRRSISGFVMTIVEGVKKNTGGGFSRCSVYATRFAFAQASAC
jgi:hypothetical protein